MVQHHRVERRGPQLEASWIGSLSLSDSGDRYARVAAGFSARVDRVGADERLDPDAVTFSFDALRPNDEAIRGEGGYGPELDPSPGADEQTCFLAFLGRRA